MANFKTSIRLGLEAYKQALADQGEIGLLVSDLNEALREVTDGAAGVRLAPVSKTEGNFELIIYSIGRPGDTKQERMLAELATDRGRFPLTFKSRRGMVECPDRKDLERVLLELVATAHAGRLIEGVIEGMTSDVD